MSRLKEKNSKKCLLVLRQFIDNADAVGEGKDAAVLALNHLQAITAGSSGPEFSGLSKSPLCIGKPLANVSL